MSQNNAPPSNIAILAALSGTMGTIQAAKAVSEMPPDGTYQLQVTSMRTADGTLKIGPQASPMEIPSLRVSFKYEMLPSAPGLPADAAFWGSGFDLISPAAMATIPDTQDYKGRKQSLDINMRRFKGHLEVLSGIPIAADGSNFLSVFQTVQNLIASNQALRVEAVIKRNKDGKYPTESLAKLIV